MILKDLLTNEKNVDIKVIQLQSQNYLSKEMAQSTQRQIPVWVSFLFFLSRKRYSYTGHTNKIFISHFSLRIL